MLKNFRCSENPFGSAIAKRVGGRYPDARLGVFALLLAALGAAAPAAAVGVYEVKAETAPSAVIIGGSVVPARQVTLAAQHPGRIALISGKEGESFNTGDLLVALDETALRAKRKEAEAAFSEAEASARNAQVQYHRELVSPQSRRATQMPGMGIPGMFDEMFTRPMSDVMGVEDSGAHRSADLHQQGTQLQQSEAALERTRAQIEQIDSQIRDSRSIAPFDGVIIRKLAEVGDTVQPGQPLLEYSDLSKLQVRASVPARLSSRLSVGQSVSVRLDSVAEPVTATVSQVFPAADAQQHTVPVKFDLPPDVGAAPGMYAEVSVPDASGTSGSRLRVPRSAVIWRGGLAGVQVLSATAQPQLRLLRVKDTGDPDWVEVYAGIKAGDRVVLP